MEEVIPCIAVAVIAMLVVGLRRHRLTSLEERFLFIALGLHIVSSLAMPWFTDNYLGGGDQVGYAAHGADLAEGMRRDFESVFPDVIRLFFQQPTVLPYDGSGGSTGSMQAITGLAMLLLGGSSYAAGMVFTLVALSGKWALYRVYRDSFPATFRVRLLWASLMIPSVLCWSSGLIKEGVMMGPLGWAIYSIHSFNGGKRLVPVLTMALCGVVIANIKAYVLLPLAAGAMVWMYWHRAMRNTGGMAPKARPLYLVVGLAFAALAIVGLGTVFPDYSVDGFAEKSARYQDIGGQMGGGSVIELGDPGERSLSGQLAYAPVALISSLFRPFVFDVRNPLMGMAAIETTALLILVLRLVQLRSWRLALRVIWSSPILMFSLLFILLFGVAVGLTTMNLGTLSRYRLPMMPLYVALILIVSSPEEAIAPVEVENDDPEASDEEHPLQSSVQELRGKRML